MNVNKQDSKKISEDLKSSPENSEIKSNKSKLQLSKISLKKVKNHIYLYNTVIVVNLICIAAGISLTWSSPVISKLNGDVETDDNPIGRFITKDEQSWIGSILSLGAASGPYLAGYLSDRIGRKKTLIICAGLPSAVAFLILAFAKNIILYYIARFLNGFTLGNVFCVLPNYVSEISESSNRGTLSSIMNVFLTCGLFFSYAVGPFISIMNFNLMCTVFPILFIMTFSFFPETPYYLVQNKKYSEAEDCLKKFRADTKEGVSVELEDIKRTVEEHLLSKGSFMDILKSYGLIRALVLSLGLVLFHQLSGINVVLFYTQTIFEATGSDMRSELSSIIIGSAQVIPSILTPILADTAGRRITLMMSTITMVLAQAPLGFYFYLKEQNRDVDALYWLPVTSLVVYIVAFRIGLGPLPWTIMAELFPPNIKLAASTATTSVCYIAAFFITRYFQNVTEIIGMAGGFWFFTICCLLATLFIYFYLPETKKKSFSEINTILYNKT